MKKPDQLYRNLHPHKQLSLIDIFRWKFGIDPPDPPSSEAAGEPLPAAWSTPTVAAATPEDLRVLWIGHSTFLIQHLGLNILTDPIFGNCPPSRFGLKRLQPPGMSLTDLPKIDVVLISHSHYDHLDADAIRFLGPAPRYFVPSGLSPWFQRRGIQSVSEIPWWSSAALTPNLTLTSVPAQHGAARTPFDRDRTHWCGWVLQSPHRSLYFVGDSGFCPTFREIGGRLGPFDLALIPIGAYNPRRIMLPVHMNPAEAIQTHLDVQSRLSIACHWGAFRLTDEPTDEPPRLLAHHLRQQNIDPASFRALQPGQTIVA